MEVVTPAPATTMMEKLKNNNFSRTPQITEVAGQEALRNLERETDPESHS